MKVVFFDRRRLQGEAAAEHGELLPGYAVGTVSRAQTIGHATLQARLAAAPATWADAIAGMLELDVRVQPRSIAGLVICVRAAARMQTPAERAAAVFHEARTGDTSSPWAIQPDSTIRAVKPPCPRMAL